MALTPRERAKLALDQHEPDRWRLDHPRIGPQPPAQRGQARQLVEV